MDDATFRQLKESQYYHPEVTDVILDSSIMMQMALHSFSIAEKGYNTVWDSEMLDFVTDNFRGGLDLLEERIREKGIKFQIITEISKDNIDKTKTLSGAIIRHLDNLSGNFGIFDNRAYMVHLTPKKGEPPDQTLWSNSKDLVEKQQALFNRLWNMAIPVSLRRKELENDNPKKQKKMITSHKELVNEINTLIEQSRKELLVFSSIKLIYTFLDKDNFVKNFMPLLRRGVNIKILVDDLNQDLLNQIIAINNKNKKELLQFGYTNKLGNFDEIVIISDNKGVLQIRYDQQNELVATFSNEEHSVWIQEILFEKYWNEVKSLNVVNNN